MAVTVGVDIGGTKVAAGLVDDEGQVLRSVRTATPTTSPADIVAAIVTLVTDLRRDATVVAVGVGAAGYVDAARSTVLFAPNLVWRDEPLRAEVADRLGLPVVVENDANAAAWAEHRFGAGRGVRDLVAVTVGTGLGGGIVTGGRLHRGRAGLAGEAGHIRVVPDGRPCGCGNRGCWEQYCSGAALLREARARGRTDLADGPAVTAAARAGDPAAVAAFEAVGSWLGQGLADLAAVLDPGRFVVGGGVSDAGDLLLAPARRRFAESVIGRAQRPPVDIVAAQLGSRAGVVGAADLARTDD